MPEFRVSIRYRFGLAGSLHHRMAYIELEVEDEKDARRHLAAMGVASEVVYPENTAEDGVRENIRPEEVSDDVTTMSIMRVGS